MSLLRLDSLYYLGSKQEIVACPPVLTRRAYFVRSLILRLNSVEVTRSQVSLDNKYFHSAPMATQTQRMCV